MPRSQKPSQPDAAGAPGPPRGDGGRGAIFTRREVADFILDLVGYSADRPLYEKRLLEPSFGGGDILLPAIGRLLASWRANGAGIGPLRGAIRAVESHGPTFGATRLAIVGFLRDRGLGAGDAEGLADAWLAPGDFLLTPLEGEFDFAVGNPPYVRHELIPNGLMAEYRRRYGTIHDRADIYVPFIERSLGLLSRGGSLGFICPNRWVKNRYGAPLRSLVAKNFHLRVFVDMEDRPAFRSTVTAYPAIVVIDRARPGPTRVARGPQISAPELSALAKTLNAGEPPGEGDPARELPVVGNGPEPWLLEPPGPTALIRRLERGFPTLGEAGCQVGVGVATGADKAFIGDFEDLDVEPSRKLRLLTTGDIASGEVRWGGLGVINPFDETGRLVDLRDHPRLGRYLGERRETLAKRHCAKKNPASWYRTIDRIDLGLYKSPKILMPDIKAKAHAVFEAGGFYPNHNIYHVTSRAWDLRALQAVLSSAVAGMFVSAYAVAMRGGFLRFQAQYLRRIRLPLWADVPGRLRRELAGAAMARDLAACDQAAFELYGLSPGERDELRAHSAQPGSRPLP